MATGEQRYRVLVVDDEEDMRTLLQMALSEVYEVATATNGLDAMLKLPRYQPDLAIVDIMMPLMNGLDLAARIRQTPGYQDLPIIALSALNSRDDIRKGYEAGADLYLTKPFQPDRVLKNVAFSLQNRPVRHKDLTIAAIEEREARLAEKTKRAMERRTAAAVSTPAPQTAAPPPQPTKGPIIPMEELTEPTPAAPRPAPVGRRAERDDDRVREHESSFWADSDAVDEDFDGPAQKPRVLMVDDDADHIVAARQALEDDFEVVTAEDGLDAMAKVPDAQPDIFIIDGMMPKMSGYQLVEMLRGTMETRALPIVFASAKGSERDKRMMFQKGVDRYLVKPFPLGELLETMREIAAMPGFRIRTKRRSIREILYDEGKRRAEAIAHVDKTKRWETYGTLEGFLKETRKKEGTH